MLVKYIEIWLLPKHLRVDLLRGNKAEMKITIEKTYESNVIHLPIPVAMKTFLSLR